MGRRLMFVWKSSRIRYLTMLLSAKCLRFEARGPTRRPVTRVGDFSCVLRHLADTILSDYCKLGGNLPAKSVYVKAMPSHT